MRFMPCCRAFFSHVKIGEQYLIQESANDFISQRDTEKTKFQVTYWSLRMGHEQVSSTGKRLFDMLFKTIHMITS